MRAPDWEPRLRAFIEQRWSAPFKWGRRENDCVSCAFAWVIEATGQDGMVGVPEYSSASDAEDILDGFGGFRAFMDARFERLAAPALAQRGDLGLAEIPRSAVPGVQLEEVIAIVEGAALLVPGRRGLARIPRRFMLDAWRV